MSPNPEIKPVWIKSDEDLKESFGKRNYGGVGYNNCSELLSEFYEMLYLKKDTYHGNVIFVEVDSRIVQTTIDPETEKKILTFSDAFHEDSLETENHIPEGEILFKVRNSEARKKILKLHKKRYVGFMRFLKDTILQKDHGYECFFGLSMCEDYKESFRRRTGNNTCPVKWFYEQHFRFQRPYHPDACIVDRALNGEPMQEWELRTFYELPIIMSPTRPRCSSYMPDMEKIAEDPKDFAFLTQNCEYAIMLSNRNLHRDVILHAF